MISSRVSNATSSSDDLHNLSRIVLGPLIYLMAKNEDVLSFRGYKLREGLEEPLEKYTLNEEIHLPVSLFYSNFNGRAKIVIVIGETVAGTAHLVYFREGRVVIASEEPTPPVVDIFTMGYTHSFPPADFDSYLFYALNPPIRRIVEDYIERQRSKLSKEFLTRVEKFKELESSVEDTPHLPQVSVKVNILECAIRFIIRKSRLKILGLMYGNTSGQIDTLTELEPFYSLVLTDEDGKRHEIAMEKNAFEYITLQLGLQDEVREVASLLRKLYQAMKRGAIILATLDAHI